MMEPKIGQKYTKNGVSIWVQDIRDGWVFVVRAPQGEMEKYWAHPGHSIADYEKPLCDNVRVPLSEWAEKVEGAVTGQAGA